MCKRAALFFRDSVDASMLEVPCFFVSLNPCLRDVGNMLEAVLLTLNMKDA